MGACSLLIGSRCALVFPILTGGQSEPSSVPKPLMMNTLSFNALFHDRRVNKFKKTPACLVAP